MLIKFLFLKQEFIISESFVITSYLGCNPKDFKCSINFPDETFFDLEEIFCEREPVQEVLIDNAPAFIAGATRDLKTKKWYVRPLYSETLI